MELKLSLEAIENEIIQDVCCENRIFLPFTIFWLLLPIFIFRTKYFLKSHNFRPLPWNILIILKFFVTVCLLVDSVFIVYLNIGKTFTELMHAVTVALTSIAILLCQILSRKSGIVSSGFLFIAWLSFSVSGIYLLLQRLPIRRNYNPTMNEMSYGTWYLGCIIQLFLHCFADKRHFKDASNPMKDASFLNRLTLWWFTKIPLIGIKRDLKLSDFFPLSKSSSATILKSKWEELWVPKVKAYTDRKACLLKILSEDVSSENDENVIVDKNNPLESLQPPSVIWTLLTMFKVECVMAMLFRLIANLMQLANPYILHQLIHFLSDPDSHKHLWMGITYAVSFFALNQIKSFLTNFEQYVMMKVAVKVQSTLISAVYEKTLNLSSASRRIYSAGEIINIMAVDLEKIQLITSELQQYWSLPFQIALTFTYLFHTLGIAALPGLLVVFFFFFLNLFAAMISKRWMHSQMKYKDERTKICSEVLDGIKVVKLYTWEVPLIRLIERLRKKELGFLMKLSVVRMGIDILNYCTPFLIALFCFLTYILADPSNQKLTPAVAFVSLVLFNQLRTPMTLIGLMINMTIEILVSNRRIKDFLVVEERDVKGTECPSSLDNSNTAVEIRNADFGWDAILRHPQEAPPSCSLHNINLYLPQGTFLAVIGSIASSKSSLLFSLMNEMQILRGSAKVYGKLAYVSQQPWIQNMSVRDNICFSKPYDEKFYQKVIEACALKKDLSMLAFGDLTEIGEKGHNLSGGQKARISLARAVYQDCDIYLLDDPLAAVDSHVANHIFKHVFGHRGLLKDKTKIMVTHGYSILPHVDRIAVMDKGRIVEYGTYPELVRNSNSKLGELFMTEADDGISEESPTNTLRLEEATRLCDDPDSPRPLTYGSFKRRGKLVAFDFSEDLKREEARLDRSNQLMSEEAAKKGRVKTDVYQVYAQSAGYRYVLMYLVFFAGYQAVVTGRHFWLSGWSNDSESKTIAAMSNSHRLLVYAGLGFAETILIIVSFANLVIASLRASKNLHDPLLTNILRAPMAFFDTIPIGRILNRFSTDIEIIDMRLPMNIRNFVLGVTCLAFTLLAICLTTPVFAIVIIPLSAIYILSLRYYIPTSCQLKRFESNSRSPIFSHFGEAVQGLFVIRVYKRSEIFSAKMRSLIDTFCQIKFMNMLANRWLSIRLELVGNLVIFFAAIFAVLSHHWGWVSNSALIGLSLSYALDIIDVLSFAIRQISKIETNIVAVERLKEFAELKQEAPWTVKNLKMPNSWVKQGHIRFSHYSTRYRSGLDLVIKNINIHVRPGEKVAIVGRTGAGKSSLTLALFRIIEGYEGRIRIDGVDISTLGLHDLRSNLTIIPQDPVCFSGTLRFNLDPFEHYSDTEIWTALEHSHLKAYVKALPNGLYHVITEGGENMSIGQRQLICLTRALLRKNKILVLDEATSAVDYATDALIQETIRKEFKDSTIFTIAHRLHTIIDYDRIIVLDHGEIKETGAPRKLLEDPSSYFSILVNQNQT